MQFTVKAEQLKRAVEFAKAGLGGGSKDLAALIFRFDVGVGGAQDIGITTSDGNVVAQALMVPDSGQGTGTFGMLGERLVKLVGAKALDFSFSVDPENIEVKGTQGGDGSGDIILNFERYNGALLDEAFEAVHEIQPETLSPDKTDIPLTVLSDALAVAGQNTVKNAGNPAVDHVELRDGMLLASDADRVCFVKSGDFHKETALKIPVSLLGRIAAAVKAVPTSLTVHPFESENYYFLGFGLKKILGVRKTEAKFPAAEHLLKGQEPARRFKVSREALISALQTVRLGLPTGETALDLETSKLGSHEVLVLMTKNMVGRDSVVRVKIEDVKEGFSKALSLTITHLLQSLGAMRAPMVEIMEDENAIRVVDRLDAREVISLLPMRSLAKPTATEKEQTTEVPQETSPEPEQPVAGTPEPGEDDEGLGAEVQID